MAQKSDRCYCAFCKSPRSVYAQKHASLMDAALVALASVLLSWLIWQEIDPRTCVFFVLGLGGAELFVIFRRRLSIECPKCGFNLLLYRKNPQLAAARVQAFRATRMEDPLWIFSPPVRMPAIRNPKLPRSAQLDVELARARGNLSVQRAGETIRVAKISP